MSAPTFLNMVQSQKQDRQSHRLRGYDYSLSAPYFVTICAEKSLHLFGTVESERMVLNEPGRMVAGWLLETQNKFTNVRVDAFQVMPNHLHAIIVLMGNGMDMASRFGLGIDDLDLESADGNAGVPLQIGEGKSTRPIVKDPSLGSVLQWFKTMTTNMYIRGVRELDWKPFAKRLWQRNYYDHIIRNGLALERTRDYIRDNPLYWSLQRDAGSSEEQSFEQWLLNHKLS